MVSRRSNRVARSLGVVVIPLVAALLIALLGIGAYRGGKLNPLICDGPCAAQYVDPPAQLGTVGAQMTIRPDVVSAGTLSAVKVAAAVKPGLAQPGLGARLGFVALDLASGAVLATTGTGAFAPASTTKLLTAYAALDTIGPQTRFATRVVSEGTGAIVLVGGGDPYLDAKRPKPAEYGHHATLSDLAARTVAALKRSGATTVTLGFDASLFSGPAVNPHWPSSYIAGNITTPVSALWVSQGMNNNGVRSREPARTAAEQFAALLKAKGIKITGQITPTRAAGSATELARVESATLLQILEALIQHSDNQATEVMLRHLAIANHKTGSFVDGVATVKTVLERNGIPTPGLTLYDGSGLSRDNRIAPTTLAHLVRLAARGGPQESLGSDLPIAGFSGSLLGRFSEPAASSARGVTRAKTGTLTGISSLAGIVQDADGQPIVFAIMADRTKVVGTLTAEAAIDRVVAELARCHCGG